jgi:peptidoglycan/LPS O-acetylase OafA/YrhL
VVLFHAFPWVCPGGFVGVDTFFVLSGYLISGILLGRLRRGTFSILEFYERRVRRIFPALFWMMAVVGLASAVVLLPSDLRRFGESVASTSLFSSNVLFWAKTGYFATAASRHPLLHTWSLAVEEQFYLFYPMLLAFVFRRGEQWIPRAIAAGIVSSLALSVVSTRYFPDAAFYLPHTRMWELLAGALVTGWRPAPRSRLVLEVGAACGLGAVLGAMALFDVVTPFPGIAAALPVAGTAAILVCCGSGPTMVGRALSWWPFQWIGRISYSWYLWHWPLLVLARYLWIDGEAPAWLIASALATSIAAAAASFAWIEQPLRVARVTRGTVLGTGLAASFGVALAGLALHFTHGLPARFGAEVLSLAAGESDKSSRTRACMGHSFDEARGSELCRLGAPTGSPGFVVWGDSHAEAMAAAIDASADAAGVSGTLVSTGQCPPLLRGDSTVESVRRCLAHNRAFLASESADGPQTVLLVGAWEWAAPRLGFPQAELGAALEEVVAALQDSGRRVVVVEDVPGSPVDVPSTLARAAAWGVTAHATWERDEFAEQQVDAIEAVHHVEVARGVRVVRPAEALCEGGTCRVQQGAKAWYVDSNHLTVTGARALAPLFDGVLLDLAGTSWSSGS